MTQLEKMDDVINRYGSITSADSMSKCHISNFSARMSEMMMAYPVKRVVVRRKEPNEDGKRPHYIRYYYRKDDIRFPIGEEILEWKDEQ